MGFPSDRHGPRRGCERGAGGSVRRPSGRRGSRCRSSSAGFTPERARMSGATIDEADGGRPRNAAARACRMTGRRAASCQRAHAAIMRVELPAPAGDPLLRRGTLAWGSLADHPALSRNRPKGLDTAACGVDSEAPASPVCLLIGRRSVMRRSHGRSRRYSRARRGGHRRHGAGMSLHTGRRNRADAAPQMDPAGQTGGAASPARPRRDPRALAVGTGSAGVSPQGSRPRRTPPRAGPARARRRRARLGAAGAPAADGGRGTPGPVLERVELHSGTRREVVPRARRMAPEPERGGRAHPVVSAIRDSGRGDRLDRRGRPGRHGRAHVPAGARRQSRPGRTGSALGHGPRRPAPAASSMA